MPRWLERMTADEIEALPRGTTVVFFPVGVIEDHGPHLPVGLDLDEAEVLCRLAAERLEDERKGWVGVIAPRSPLGVDPNTRAWAFGVRGYVLKDYLVDVGSTWLRQGFRFLVCFSGTQSPRSLVAIEEAGRILSRRAKRARMRLFEFLKSSQYGPPSLVSGRSGGSKPSDIWTSALGVDPSQHGGERDTGVAMWLYQDTARAPREPLPPAFPLTGSRISRMLERWRNRRWGYWGDPSRADPARAQEQSSEELTDFSAKLGAWIEGASPDRLFGSWHALMPSNRTTFKAWLLFAAILVLFLAYIREPKIL
ncbi:MAG: creatininase family protein [Oligoflexia bacterium]